MSWKSKFSITPFSPILSVATVVKSIENHFKLGKDKDLDQVNYSLPEILLGVTLYLLSADLPAHFRCRHSSREWCF